MSENGDYISREALLEQIDGIWDCADLVFEPNDHCCRADDCASCKWAETKNAIRKIIANFHAADVRPVVRGKWTEFSGRAFGMAEDGTRIALKMHTCSECKKHSIDAFYTNFCPNCGADMREES